MRISDSSFAAGEARAEVFSRAIPFTNCDVFAELFRDNLSARKPANSHVRPALHRLERNSKIEKYGSPQNGDKGAASSSCTFYPETLLTLENNRPVPRIVYPEMEFNEELWHSALSQVLPARSQPKAIFYANQNTLGLLRQQQLRNFRKESNKSLLHAIDAFVSPPPKRGKQRPNSVSRFIFLGHVLIDFFWREGDGSFKEVLPTCVPCLTNPLVNERGGEIRGSSFSFFTIEINGQTIAVAFARNLAPWQILLMHNLLSKYDAYMVF